MTEKQVIEEIIEYSKIAFDKNLVPGTSGNTSMLYDGKIYITATNTCLGNLRPENITVCDLDGNVIRGEVPSKETPMHLLVYKKRPDIKCVMHLHPTNVVALSLLNKSVPHISATFNIKVKDVPVMPFAFPKTPELLEGIEKVLDDNPECSIFTISEHGTVAFADSLINAFNLTALVEDTAKMGFLTNLI